MLSQTYRCTLCGQCLFACLLGFFVCVSVRHSVCVFEINKFARIPLGQLERLRPFGRVLKRVKNHIKISQVRNLGREILFSFGDLNEPI